MRLGFVGAGRMGRPMVDRLVQAGHEVAVLGRSPESRGALADSGAQAHADLAAVAAGADAVLVCVFTDDQVRRVCVDDGLVAAMRPGATLVVHTTCNPRTVEGLAEHAAAHDVSVVDAAVSGGPHDIAAGRLTILVGGAEAAFAAVCPALSAYGDPVLHVGALGHGQRVKLVNNAVFTANIGLLAAAVDLGKQLGIDETTLLSALPHGSAASRALAGVAAKGSVAGFFDSVGEFVRKDIAVVRSVTADLGTDLGVLDAVIPANS
ncbi:NAD(P)-dependent oxidoreductase [Nocardia sp. alder85J]|uniref:NAD(P)-dependent oxidoreductase n=1 Tax=Nocardia sp. alder85J TaxID=2862949 RepID=UPI001CD22D1B|nr:NAD(P)-dependent oxidoreductase [Nocardia sp. alder85J]MCX4090759.1 NAD(P)-dependent oxidoreductase [Nocardia sp. alder85J]